MSGASNGTVADALKAYGLSDQQVGELTALQEQGRGIDFRYHFTDDGSDPLKLGSHIDEFMARLREFAAEGEVPREFAVSLWEHVTPRFIGWKPDFAEEVESRHLGYFHVRLDQEIDERLGRDIPQSARAAALDVRERFDDLSFAYEAGAWRDSRTPGEVRDELLFVASLDEKLRDVLYGGAKLIDLTQEMADLTTVKSVSPDSKLEPSFEARAYQAQLTSVADILDRLRDAGVEIRTGLVTEARVERQSSAAEIQKEKIEPTQVRATAAAHRMRRPPAPRPAADASAYWRGVGEKSASATLSPASVTQSHTQSTRRGRSI